MHAVQVDAHVWSDALYLSDPRYHECEQLYQDSIRLQAEGNPAYDCVCLLVFVWLTDVVHAVPPRLLLLPPLKFKPPWPPSKNGARCMAFRFATSVHVAQIPTHLLAPLECHVPRRRVAGRHVFFATCGPGGLPKRVPALSRVGAGWLHLAPAISPVFSAQ